MLWRSRSDAGDVHCVGVNAADCLLVDVKSRQTAIEYIAPILGLGWFGCAWGCLVVFGRVSVGFGVFRRVWAGLGGPFDIHTYTHTHTHITKHITESLPTEALC